MPQQSARTSNIRSYEVPIALSNGQVHPRLRLQCYITPGEHGAEIHDLVLVDIAGCRTRDHFETLIIEAIEQSAEIKKMRAQLNDAIDALSLALLENDNFLAEQDSRFAQLLRAYEALKSILDDSDKTTKAKDRRKRDRTQKRVQQKRQILDARLIQREESQNDLPHPINQTIENPERNTKTIAQLRSEYNRVRSTLDRSIERVKKSPETLEPTLNGYLHEQGIPPSTCSQSLTQQILSFCQSDGITIFELEGLDEIESIPTDHRGYPTDTACPPIEINIQVIRRASETGDLVFTEGYLAFTPQGAWSLVGRMHKGHLNLVLIPNGIMSDIILLEERFFNSLPQIIAMLSAPRRQDARNQGAPEDPPTPRIEDANILP